MKNKRSKKGEKITNWEYSTLRKNNLCPNCLTGKVKPLGTPSVFTDYFCPCCGQGYCLSIDSIFKNSLTASSYILF